MSGRRARVTVRVARPDDAPGMARLMRAAVRAAASGYPAGAAAAWGALPALYHRWAMTAGGETRLVAQAGGRLLGFAGWRGREVTALFVHPRAAGRGLGGRLLAAAEAGAARSGARTVRLVAAREALGFYLAQGWRPRGPAASPLPGGLTLPAVRMEKAVGGRRGRGGGASQGRLRGHPGRLGRPSTSRVRSRLAPGTDRSRR